MARPTSLRKSLPGLRRTIRYFWPYVSKERGLLVGSLAALFAEIVFRLIEPWPLKFIFDRVIVTAPNGGQTGLGFIDGLAPNSLLLMSALALVLATALRAAAAYRTTVGFALIGNRVLTKIRSKLYRHLQRLSLNFHAKAKDGDVVVRMISDVGMLKEVAVTAFLPLVGDAFVLLGMFTIMLLLQWQLALLSLLVFPLFLLTSQRLGKRIQAVSRKQRKREGAMAATAAESIGAIKTVQALSLEASFAESFASQNNKSLKEGVKAKRLQARLERTVDVLTAIATALVVYTGAGFILSGLLTPGDLIVFMSYLKSAFKPIKNFAKYTGRLAKASAAGERVLELLEQDIEVKNYPHAVSAPPLKGRLHFKNISFAYEGDKAVLQDVDFVVEAAQRIALVGTSGNGKSTLLSLIPRLYDPTRGSLLIDGHDVRDYTLESLRSQISIVLQESLLFGLSVRENIALGQPEAKLPDIVKAAQLAQAHAFITALPEGYDTILGERGATLSGGQRQRIAIARAALRNAPLLLLDEPTTGLDEENERAVIEALERLSKGKTTFLVTHNLDLAARADRIFYLEDGQVLEQGAHKELMALGGRYASLYGLQRASKESRYAVVS